MRAPRKAKPKLAAGRRKVSPAAKSRAGARAKTARKAQPKSRASVRRAQSARAAPGRGAASRAAARRPPRKRAVSLASVSVGDAVRIPAEVRNLILRYDPRAAQEGRGGEAIEGIVSSIREIKTGKLVAKTTGNLSDYVLEVVHSQTFRPHLGSDRNTGGPRGPDDIRENPVWSRLRDVLRDMAETKRLVSTSGGGMSEEPLRSLLDGWRVVKVKAEHVEAMS